MNIVAAKAYKLTDIEPNIIGPTAPLGTFSPCEIQSATIVVKNIAGKTDAIPANKGDPCWDNQTATPMAIAAAIPLENKTTKLTLFLPDGAG